MRKALALSLLALFLGGCASNPADRDISGTWINQAAIKAAIFGDLLQNVKNRMMPYELQKGETQRLFDKWMAACKDVLKDGGYFKFQRTVKQIVKEFDNIPIDETLWKPKVGIVGEIYVKFAPLGNNNLEAFLEKEDCEVVVPGRSIPWSSKRMAACWATTPTAPVWSVT